MNEITNDKTFNLEERTAVFSEQIIILCQIIPKNLITLPVVNQIIRSGTSIGANYYEANGACSKKDFKNKLYICKKEAKETGYWLRLLAKTTTDEKIIEDCRRLWKESHELTLIFSSIIIKTK